MPLLSRLRRPAGRTRPLLGAILALAIALRLLVPQGWMPAPSGGLMICSGQTAAMHHGGQHSPAKPVEDHGCPFAALGLAAVPATPATGPILPRPSVRSDLVPVQTFAAGHGLAAPPPPATGPPAFA